MVPLSDQLRKRFAAAPISNKILAIVTLCSLLSLTLISAASVLVSYRSTSHREIERVNSMASILASNTVASLRFNDQETAAEYLQSLTSEPSITCAVLYDAQKSVFADYHRKLPCPHPDYPETIGTSSSGSSFTAIKQVMLAGQPIGVLLLRSDATKFWKDIILNLAISCGVMLCGLAGSVLLAKRLLPVITDPIEELANLAHRVSEERNYTLRALKRNNDEIGLLVDSFNFMLASIRQRDTSINETNRNLEHLVANRTAKLAEAREKAEQALSAKGDFLAFMSHELRTPMNAIIGMSSILQHEGLDEKRSRQIEIIQKSSNSLLQLINDILDYSKIEANCLELEDGPFDLVSSIEESMDIACAGKGNPKIVPCICIDPHLPEIAQGDETRIRQVILNLLSNAFKFTKEGFVKITATRLRAENNKPDRIQISVQDTGIGIRESRLERIFDTFAQADSSTTHDYGGTGLGLTISNRLAIAMGGSIEVESQVGIGSTFKFEIPCAAVGDSFVSERGKPEVPIGTKIGLFNLSKQMETCLLQCFQSWGCTVLTQSNGDPLDNVDTLVASALASTEAEAVKLALAVPYHTNTLLVCHSEHSRGVKKSKDCFVLTAPIRLIETGAMLAATLEKRKIPKLEYTSTVSRYPINKWNSLHVLLVEDNEHSKQAFSLQMEMLGIKVDLAPDGESANKLVESNNYDLIFMDIQMPIMGGIEATQRIRKMGSTVQQPWIIAYTANSDPKTLAEIERSGMDDYLAKPAQISDIAESIKRFEYRHKS